MPKFVINFFIMCIVLWGSTTASGAADILPFSTGETITYSIKKMGVRVGTATLEFQGKEKLKEKEVYLIVFTADGINFYDQERIYADIKDFYPLRIERDLNIFGKKEVIIEEYDSIQGVVKIVKTTAGSPLEETIVKSGRLDNIYCFLYRYRWQGSFELGQALALNLPTKDISVSIENKTRLKTAGRDFDAYFMNSDRGEYRMWFDSSADKIPLRIDGAIKFGKTAMVMTGYKK